MFEVLYHSPKILGVSSLENKFARLWISTQKQFPPVPGSLFLLFKPKNLSFASEKLKNPPPSPDPPSFFYMTAPSFMKYSLSSIWNILFPSFFLHGYGKRLHGGSHWRFSKMQPCTPFGKCLNPSDCIICPLIGLIRLEIAGTLSCTTTHWNIYTVTHVSQKRKKRFSGSFPRSTNQDFSSFPMANAWLWVAGFSSMNLHSFRWWLPEFDPVWVMWLWRAFSSSPHQRAYHRQSLSIQPVRLVRGGRNQKPQWWRSSRRSHPRGETSPKADSKRWILCWRDHTYLASSGTSRRNGLWCSWRWRPRGDTVSGRVNSTNTAWFADVQPPLPPFSLQLNFTGETLAMSPEISAMTNLGRSFISKPVETSNFGIEKALRLQIEEISGR